MLVTDILELPCCDKCVPTYSVMALGSVSVAEYERNPEEAVLRIRGRRP